MKIGCGVGGVHYRPAKHSRGSKPGRLCFGIPNPLPLWDDMFLKMLKDLARTLDVATKTFEGNLTQCGVFEGSLEVI